MSHALHLRQTRKSLNLGKNKIKICESEASESQYWLEIIAEAKWLSWEKLKPEYDECNELLAIFASIGKNM